MAKAQTAAAATTFPETGMFLSMTMLIPISGDLFADSKTVMPAGKAIDDFKAALGKIDGLQVDIKVEQIRKRGAKETPAATPANGQAPNPKPNPDEPPLSLDEAQRIEREAEQVTAEMQRPAWAAPPQ